MKNIIQQVRQWLKEKLEYPSVEAQVKEAKHKGQYMPGWAPALPPRPRPTDRFVSPQADYVSPTVTPTPTPQGINRLALMLLGEPVATESAKKMIEDVLTQYIPKTQDVPRDWKTPLLAYADQMARQAYENKLNPLLQPLLAIAETQAMRPMASGTQMLNPYNVMVPGTQQLFDYRPMGLGYALERFPQNITRNWRGEGWQQFRKNPTLENLVYAQNPQDNPEMQIENIIRIARQLGY